ncbi:hypothetical protein [Paraburkholderia sp. BL6665CI2N2]|uniref:hypothetical protein n=1 Tax=Paraburkholderia sp. BL6665CI2N2 TaxID=1938806 RepID=UPI0014170CB1|nr:hypothetical protein [Paraburkholderia sp. BL6665CI2N2]
MISAQRSMAGTISFTRFHHVSATSAPLTIALRSQVWAAHRQVEDCVFGYFIEQ